MVPPRSLTHGSSMISGSWSLRGHRASVGGSLSFHGRGSWSPVGAGLWSVARGPSVVSSQWLVVHPRSTQPPLLPSAHRSRGPDGISAFCADDRLMAGPDDLSGLFQPSQLRDIGWDEGDRCRRRAEAPWWGFLNYYFFHLLCAGSKKAALELSHNRVSQPCLKWIFL